MTVTTPKSPKRPARKPSRTAGPPAARIETIPPGETMLYIAYGSNLNVGQMRLRCPKARRVGPMVLKNWKLVFRGVADIEKAPGAELQCGVWRITSECERALDRYEGVAGGLDRKEYIVIRVTLDGTVSDERALVYVMNESGYSLPGDHYFRAILDGYADFGLPVAGLALARGEAEVEYVRRSRRRSSEWDWPPRKAKAPARRDPAAAVKDWWRETA